MAEAEKPNKAAQLPHNAVGVAEAVQLHRNPQSYAQQPGPSLLDARRCVEIMPPVCRRNPAQKLGSEVEPVGSTSSA
jgi:hypothetical protein